jgi:hypothetical protein
LLYLFGGISNNGEFSSDVHLSTSSNVSILITACKRILSCHFMPLAAGTAMQDLYSFDPADGRWSQLTSRTSGSVPAARYGHGVAAVGRAIYVFGGCGPSGEKGMYEDWSQPFLEYVSKR